MIDAATLVTMGGTAVSAVAAVFAAAYSWIDSHKIQEVHLSLNSRLDTLIRNAESVGRTEGAAEARENDKRARAEQSQTEP